MIAHAIPMDRPKPATTMSAEPIVREPEVDDFKWILEQQRELCHLREKQLRRDGRIYHNGKVIENAK